MGKITLRNLVYVLVLTSASKLLAQPIAKQNAALENTHKVYSVLFSTGINSNLMKSSTADHTLDNDYSLSISLKPMKDNAISLGLGALKDLKGERKFYWYDGSLSYSHRLLVDELYSINGQGLLIIPMSKESRDNQGLRTGLMLAPSITTNFGSETFMASFRPSARYNIHRYKTKRDGGSSTEYALSARLTLSYMFTDQLSVSAVNTYTRNTSYYGNTRDLYSFIQSIDFQANEMLTLSLGHANGGNALAPNGTETEIELYDHISSQIFFALTLSF